MPHTTIGTSGTSAFAAIRTAPVFSSLIRKLWEIVASGKMPTTSPARRAASARAIDSRPAARSTLMCPKVFMNGPPTGWSKISFFAMKRV
ncbi:hypothetical protein GCM10025786_12300 [Nocardioides caeni]